MQANQSCAMICSSFVIGWCFKILEQIRFQQLRTCKLGCNDAKQAPTSLTRILKSLKLFSSKKWKRCLMSYLSQSSSDRLIVPLDLPDSLIYYWWFVSWFGNRLHPEWVQIVYNIERWCWHSPLRVDFSAMACLPCISLHKRNIPMPSCSRLLVPIPIMNSKFHC